MFPETKRNLLLFKILQEKNIPVDIFSQVYLYIYGSFKLKRDRYMRTICFYINVASSRKNGFDNQEMNDTDDPHWMFSIPRFDQDIITNGFAEHYEVSMQAINCNRCGDYEISGSTVGFPQCRCHE
jgi:hypothetical protein